MRILLLGLNYAPEPIGIAVYTSGLCERLVEMGHEVQVVAGQPYYPQWKTYPGYKGGWRGAVERGVGVLRCPIYVPARPNGARRMLHHLSFALSAAIPAWWKAFRFRPDVVMTVAPSLAGAPVAYLASRLCGARNWLHVQDFEVEAAFATGLLDSTSRSARIVRAIEHRILLAFDRVSTISPEMGAKLRTMGVRDDRIVEFRNWSDIAATEAKTADTALRREWEIETPHVALYSGNIANKQGIEIVLDAARRLQSRRDLTFVVCGNGPNRARLQMLADGLFNIRFHDLQPVERLGDLLALASVHLLPQKAEAADLVLPSKLTNMLASGRPVVATALAGTGLAREVDGCGIVTPPEDAAAFAQAIETVIDTPSLRAAYGRAARERALSRWSKRAIIDQVERDLAALVSVR